MRELDELDARVDEILNRRPVVGLMVGVVRDGRLEFVYRHWLADIASHAANRTPPRRWSTGSASSRRQTPPGSSYRREMWTDDTIDR